MNTVNWLAFTLQMVLMILFPIGLAIFFKRRFHVSWVVFFIAAGFYLINLVVQLPLVFAWYSLFGKIPWLQLALVTLTYALCEETMRYLSFRAGSIMRANRTMNGALMAGAGHGGTESIIFAIGAAFTLSTALLMPQTSKVSRISVADIVNAPWWTFILLGFSRVLAITTHLGLASLTVLAYRRSWLFYPLAIFAHFVLDFTTFGVQSLTSSSLWTLLVFALWAIAALFLILRIRHMDLAAPEQRSQHLENSPTTITG